jgi:hypothetical protein
MYWENKADVFGAKPMTIPFAISVFSRRALSGPEELGLRLTRRNQMKVINSQASRS